MPSLLCFVQLLAQAPAPQGPEPLPHPDIPPPLHFEPGWSWAVWMGIGVATLALMGLLLSILLSRRETVRQPPKRPLQTALRAMKDLRNKIDVIAPAEVGHGVSEILRQYYLDRYGIPAPFKTTEELFPQATRNDEPLRRRHWRERFESLAALYDSLSYMPPPLSKPDAVGLVDSAISKLEEERLLHEDSVAA